MDPLPLAFAANAPIQVFILLSWIILCKGLALWKAAQLNQKYWFILLLIVNTFGILEVAYLFYFAKKKMKPHKLMFWKNLRPQKKE